MDEAKKQDGNGLVAPVAITVFQSLKASFLVSTVPCEFMSSNQLRDFISLSSNYLSHSPDGFAAVKKFANLDAPLSPVKQRQTRLVG